VESKLKFFENILKKLAMALITNGKITIKKRKEASPTTAAKTITIIATTLTVDTRKIMKMIKSKKAIAAMPKITHMELTIINTTIAPKKLRKLTLKITKKADTTIKTLTQTTMVLIITMKNTMKKAKIMIILLTMKIMGMRITL